ncbi:MAG: class I SAM-dependent methyltransferase [Planctomycetota bacterium]
MKKESSFYDHFSQDKTTRIGRWLVKATSSIIFNAAKISPNSSILEIGPGRGALADICLENNIDYWAIEPNTQMAESLRKRGANVISKVVPPLPDIDKKFDAVIMIHVMEHMDTMSTALQLAKEIYDILKPGGKIVISSPDYVNWRHNFFRSDFSHNYVTTWQRLQSLLVSAGFEHIDGTCLSGPLKGPICFLPSAIASLLPLGTFVAMFPKNKLLHKLTKLQGTFLRSALVIGKKAGSTHVC